MAFCIRQSSSMAYSISESIKNWQNQFENPLDVTTVWIGHSLVNVRQYSHNICSLITEKVLNNFTQIHYHFFKYRYRLCPLSIHSTNVIFKFLLFVFSYWFLFRVIATSRFCHAYSFIHSFIRIAYSLLIKADHTQLCIQYIKHVCVKLFNVRLKNNGATA